ncbi:MAG: ABC transporter permease subunit, partial [Pseudomonadota bacterium]
MSSSLTEPQETLGRPAKAGLWRRLRGYPIVPIAVLVLLLLVPAVTADWLAPHDPIQGSVVDRNKPPVLFGGTWEYPLGTDRLGRDILTRIMHGAKVSLSISLVGIFFGGFIGTTLGLLAGYFRGWPDAVIMRLVDISLALPSILLALVLAAATGPSFQTVII